MVDIATDGTPSFIGNIVTEETRCGGADNPWVLRAKPGQTINITLMDFGVSLREQSEAENLLTPKICRSVFKCLILHWARVSNFNSVRTHLLDIIQLHHLSTANPERHHDLSLFLFSLWNCL